MGCFRNIVLGTILDLNIVGVKGFTPNFIGLGGMSSKRAHKNFKTVFMTPFYECPRNTIFGMIKVQNPKII